LRQVVSELQIGGTSLQQGQPEFLRVLRIVLRMGAIALERDCVLDFARHGPDMDIDAEAAQALHEASMEIRDRHRLERDAFGAAVVSIVSR
jgi:hypothetical protein